MLGGLGDDRIAGGKGGGDLTQKYRQRKIPRADAHKRAARVQRQFVGLAGGPRQHFRLGKILPAQRGIVAAKIRRLAHFAQRVRQCLARFTHHQRHEKRTVLFEQIGGAIQHRRARHCFHARPFPRQVECQTSELGIGFFNDTDLVETGRINDIHHRTTHHITCDDRLRVPIGFGQHRRHFGVQVRGGAAV